MTIVTSIGEIKKLDIKSINKNGVNLIIGKRSTGTSSLVKDILYNVKDIIPFGNVISKSDNLTHFYDKFITKNCIRNEYSPELLKDIIDNQYLSIQKNLENQNAFLIIDKAASEARYFTRDPAFQELFYNGRWNKLFTIMILTVPGLIPSSLRNVSNYVFIFKSSNKMDRTRLYKDYASSIFSSQKDFEEVLDACTSQNYNCLVLDYTGSSYKSKVEDQVFYYKAEEYPDFQIKKVEKKETRSWWGFVKSFSPIIYLY